MKTYSPYSCLQYQEIISGSVISNRYLIQSILGQGELGRIYSAVDSYRFYEPCLLRELNLPDLDILKALDNDLKAKLYRLLKREAELLYQLDHSQINKFFAYFQEKGRFFLVQEYIQEKSYANLLQQRIQQGQTFKETEIIAWLINLLFILQYIHDRGIIHRNIAPQNILQSASCNLPILINFGVGEQSLSLIKQEYQHLSNSLNSVASSLKVTKSFANQIAYAPYEQIKLGLAFPCSDLYALGVTAIVLLTGKQPSSLIDKNTLEWRWQFCTKVSKSFTQIINKLLAYNPKHRYQSAREVIKDLQSWQSTQNVPKQKISNQLRKVVKNNENPTQINNPRRSRQEESRNRTKTLSSVHTSYSPSPQFIEICQHKLAYSIGPIASLIIEEVLDSNMYVSDEELIRAIATEIPDWQKSLEFQQAMQPETNSLI
ncbi:MAG: serine/threonine-protein kinase [Xenococcaceae cyanobacterium MO_188.B29]|nr:serine/threonine-protein kinase [Xenococcaceae cyanobacterium MO_188.B29]